MQGKGVDEIDYASATSSGDLKRGFYSGGEQSKDGGVSRNMMDGEAGEMGGQGREAEGRKEGRRTVKIRGGDEGGAKAKNIQHKHLLLRELSLAGFQREMIRTDSWKRFLAKETPHLIALSPQNAIEKKLGANCFDVDSNSALDGETNYVLGEGTKLINIKMPGRVAHLERWENKHVRLRVRAHAKK